jgi:cell division protein FtsA
MNSINNNTKSAVLMSEMEQSKDKEAKIEEPKGEPMAEAPKATEQKNESTENKIRGSFFDKYVEKIKEFLDNAE